ncbi:MAG: flagellar basal body-associated protein FliL [Rhodobacteraceae bacterium]|nr:flagellar basal body-associated protein FliL [Paracoccaceae bacterium]
MIAKLLPVLIVLLGVAGGVGAGLWLRPAPPPPDAEAQAETGAPLPLPPDAPSQGTALFELHDQFLVPLLREERLVSVIVMSLALEVAPPALDLVRRAEPRLRDRLLQVMFDHANDGGFHGVFTANNTMTLLRRLLLEAAQDVLGPDVVSGVLITDILRSGS